MSIAGYFGRNSTVLRLKDGDVPASDVPGLQGGAEVLSGRISVQEALDRAAQKGGRLGESYASVEDYDPVLRAHCRLDKEG